jgi:hypothetical protein
MLVLVAVWSAAPLATGAIAPVTTDTRINVDVPLATSVTPGFERGTANVDVPNLSIPGEPRDATSAGWRMTTNWVNGYEVRLRATTDPALRGQNVVDQVGAASSFADYSTASGCPCSWSGADYTRGVFGYSVSVTPNAGSAPLLDTAKWGTSTSRKWRGFSKSSYRAYSTAAGAGTYNMTIHFRTMIPNGTTQLAGAYRSSVIASAHPLL